MWKQEVGLEPGSRKIIFHLHKGNKERRKEGRQRGRGETERGKEGGREGVRETEREGGSGYQDEHKERGKG